MAKKQAAAQFRNRIIEYGVKPADQFTANPSNPRVHPEFQRNVMKSALETVGFVAPVIEARNGYLLDGHERVYQALGNDNAPVPYVVVDVDDDEADYVLATFDPITGLATYDRDILSGLLENVNSDNEAVQQMLADLAKTAGIMPDFDGESNTHDIIPEQWIVLVECANERVQIETLEILTEQGYTCRALMS